MRPALLAIALCLVSLATATAGTSARLLRPGDTMERFGLPLLVPSEGRKMVFVDDLLGRTAPPTRFLIVSFFASHCKPCLKELPMLADLFRRLQNDGLAMVMINIDREPEGLEAMRLMVEQERVACPVLSDRLNIVARRFFGENINLPAVFVADGRGVVLQAFSGYQEDIVAQLERIVQQDGGRAAGAPASDGSAAPAVGLHGPASVRK